MQSLYTLFHFSTLRSMFANGLEFISMYEYVMCARIYLYVILSVHIYSLLHMCRCPFSIFVSKIEFSRSWPVWQAAQIEAAASMTPVRKQDRVSGKSKLKCHKDINGNKMWPPKKTISKLASSKNTKPAKPKGAFPLEMSVLNRLCISLGIYFIYLAESQYRQNIFSINTMKKKYYMLSFCIYVYALKNV